MDSPVDLLNHSTEEEPSPVRREEASPLLYVDVNLGPDSSQRIVVHEGETA